jgi:hypothetical protein
MIRTAVVAMHDGLLPTADTAADAVNCWGQRAAGNVDLAENSFENHEEPYAGPVVSEEAGAAGSSTFRPSRVVHLDLFDINLYVPFSGVSQYQHTR